MIQKQKNVKITKQKHAFKGSASSYNVEILNSFNHQLQVKDTESAIKSKLIDWLSELKGFKFATTLVLAFQKVESKDKRRYFLFKLKSRNNYPWKWYCWCISINLYYN